MSEKSLTILRVLEKPPRRLFRVVIRRAAASAPKAIEFYTCDRVVNMSPVWERMKLRDDPHDTGFLSIFVIERSTGAVLNTYTIRAWSEADFLPAVSVSSILDKCEKTHCVALVKWGEGGHLDKHLKHDSMRDMNECLAHCGADSTLLHLSLIHI